MQSDSENGEPEGIWRSALILGVKEQYADTEDDEWWVRLELLLEVQPPDLESYTAVHVDVFHESLMPQLQPDQPVRVLADGANQELKRVVVEAAPGEKPWSARAFVGKGEYSGPVDVTCSSVKARRSETLGFVVAIGLSVTVFAAVLMLLRWDEHLAGIVFAVGFLAIWIPMGAAFLAFRSQQVRREERLAGAGVATSATLERVRPAGTPNQLRFEMVLRVRLPGGDSYTALHCQVVDLIHLIPFEAAREVPVIVDPSAREWMKVDVTRWQTGRRAQQLDGLAIATWLSGTSPPPDRRRSTLRGD
ncbi:MAG: hypothetical protein R3B13_03970 [Polyangiaceae bacterium]